MPNENDHLDKAKHNLSFFETIDKTTYGDWAVTSLFYTGLHYIDAFLATIGQHPQRHDRRDNAVVQVSELKPISKDYFHLKNSSRNARYNPPTSFDNSQIMALKENHFKKLKEHILSLFPNASP